MPYRLTYIASIDFVPPGRGLGMDTQSVGSSCAQTLTVFNSAPPVTPAVSNTFVAGDVTALLATMSADLSTQFNANLTRVQGFATGGG
jgi:hypothetical protein